MQDANTGRDTRFFENDIKGVKYGSMKKKKRDQEPGFFSTGLMRRSTKPGETALKGGGGKNKGKRRSKGRYGCKIRLSQTGRLHEDLML